MSLNEIAKKLIRKNKSRYLMLSISVCFAILMTGSYGILLFSPAITDVLMTDGSTYLIALGMYAITVIGIVIFLFYANAIFMKFQMSEIGIFLSLGMLPKAITKMHNTQFNLVFAFSGVIGIALSIPFSFAVWSFLTLFLSYTAHIFTIGWIGIAVTTLLWLLAWGVLRVKNTATLLKWDFYPYAKPTQLDILLESGSVYLLLIFFIAIIAFISAFMIMCLKITGTILQDQISYQKAVYLGLKKIIRKQIALVYFFPTICGGITATFMINRFMMVSSVTHISAITILAIILSFIIGAVQVIVFYIIQQKLVSTAVKEVYKSR